MNGMGIREGSKMGPVPLGQESSLKSCAKQRYMERMSALPESERKSFTIPIYDRIVARMM